MCAQDTSLVNSKHGAQDEHLKWQEESMHEPRWTPRFIFWSHPYASSQALEDIGFLLDCLEKIQNGFSMPSPTVWIIQ